MHSFRSIWTVCCVFHVENGLPSSAFYAGWTYICARVFVSLWLLLRLYVSFEMTRLWNVSHMVRQWKAFLCAFEFYPRARSLPMRMMAMRRSPVCIYHRSYLISGDVRAIIYACIQTLYTNHYYLLGYLERRSEAPAIQACLTICTRTMHITALIVDTILHTFHAF